MDWSMDETGVQERERGSYHMVGHESSDEDSETWSAETDQFMDVQAVLAGEPPRAQVRDAQHSDSD